jgi:predicted ester cyclase
MHVARGRHHVDTAENKALIRRFYAEIDAGNIDAMDELVAEHYVDHNPPPFPGLPGGREGLKQAFRIFWEATPGRHEIEDQIAEGDKVVTRLTAYGRHERDLPGPLAATGAELRETAVAIHRIRAGRIVEHWSDRDDLGLMQQLGVVTPRGA